jgi:hypothetical protein
MVFDVVFKLLIDNNIDDVDKLFKLLNVVFDGVFSISVVILLMVVFLKH